MAEKQEVRCVKRYWDSTRSKRFYPGMIWDIDPEEPAAAYFEGWAPGTKVYHKERGSKTKAVKETHRIIPGGKSLAPEETEEKTSPPAATEEGELEKEGMCRHCGKGPFKNLGAHLKHCPVVSG